MACGAPRGPSPGTEQTEQRVMVSWASEPVSTVWIMLWLCTLSSPRPYRSSRRRCVEAVWYRQMAAAEDRFRLSAAPHIGIATT